MNIETACGESRTTLVALETREASHSEITTLCHRKQKAGFSYFLRNFVLCPFECKKRQQKLKINYFIMLEMVFFMWFLNEIYFMPFSHSDHETHKEWKLLHPHTRLASEWRVEMIQLFGHHNRKAFH